MGALMTGFVMLLAAATPGLFLFNALDERDVVFQHHHLFNYLSLVLSLILLFWGTWLIKDPEKKRDCKNMLAVQLFWCTVVGLHLYHGIRMPGSFFQLSFIA